MARFGSKCLTAAVTFAVFLTSFGISFSVAARAQGDASLQAPAAAQGAATTPGAEAPVKGPLLQKTVRKDTGGVTAAPTPAAQKARRDMWIAYRMARDPWFDRAALADPGLVAAVCAHAGPARALAKHRHIATIAEADHYLCRRLTRWKGATWALVHNPHCDRVVLLDPEGIYRAIRRDPTIARVLASHIMFSQMIVENPDLGRFIARHM